MLMIANAVQTSRYVLVTFSIARNAGAPKEGKRACTQQATHGTDEHTVHNTLHLMTP